MLVYILEYALTPLSSRVIPNSQSLIPNVTGNSITTAWCGAQKAAFGDNYTFKTHGGMASMSSALKAGVTLVMSVWDDHYANMLWLDSTYPTTAANPGAPRGTCDVTSGVPANVESKSPSASVTYSNIKVGPLSHSPRWRNHWTVVHMRGHAIVHMCEEDEVK
jgi:cellulose 1,4-beta-cellobiosidase